MSGALRLTLPTTPVVLWLPCPPDNANARDHWAAASKKKKAYQGTLTERQGYRYHIPKPPELPIPFAEILVEWFYKDGRHHLDPDNAIRRLKPACDWLVKYGYLEGDTDEHVRWLPVVKHVASKIPPALCTVRLTLTPHDAMTRP